MADEKFEAGTQMRRRILGDRHVDRSHANQTEFDADFQRYITEAAWGSVWTRGGLEIKTRHLLTLVILAATGKERELALHLRATVNSGVTADEVKEAFFQVAAYAGIPAANSAFAIAKEVLAEIDE